jgi:hypothetical protein
MTAPRDPDRLIRAFLAEGQTELPDRAYDAVRDSIDHTRQRVVIGPWREPRMSNIARIALVAAAVLVVAVVGINFLPRSSGPGGGPAPTLSPSPSPSPVVLPDTGDLAPDTTYLIEKVDVTPGRFTLSVPAGWETISYAIIGKTDGGAKGPGAFRAALSPWIVASVYTDPCKWNTSATSSGRSGSPVDALANALSEQVGRNGSPPTDATIGGVSGKKVELSVPDDFDSLTCDGGDLKTWLNGGAGGGYGGYVYGPGQHNTVYIVDVNGELLVLDTMYLPTATAADKAELQAIVDSIRIEP